MVGAIRQRCRLNQPFELWCIALAATSQRKEVNKHLKDLFLATFKGWWQTRVNEKANKVLRDPARCDNASKARAELGAYS